MNLKRSQKGFVALMSVIIISAMLLTIIFTLNLSSFFARFDALAGENKRVSLGLAEACVEAAKLKLAKDSTYFYPTNPPAVGESVTVTGSYSCKMCKITKGVGNSYTFDTRAAVGPTNGKSYTNITAVGTLATSTFAITSWSETASNPNPSCTL